MTAAVSSIAFPVTPAWKQYESMFLNKETTNKRFHEYD
jgi:hypothetical protein